MRENEIEGESLTFEVSETDAMANIEETKKVILQVILSAIGHKRREL